MKVDLPRPLHGWRKFAGEVGIIVLGVLLALGAEQLAQTVHIRSDTAEAFEAVKSELALSAGVYEERVAQQPCLDQRLKQLGLVVSAARQSHSLPDVGWIGGGPAIRPIQSVAWSSAMSGGLVERFPKLERDRMRLHYSQSENFHSDVDDERVMWATLRILQHQPGPIDGALLAEAASTLERLRYRSWLNGVNADQLMADMKSIGIGTNYYMLADDDEKIDRTVMLEKIRASVICRPLLVDGKALAV
ncbi:hypothetical protein LZ496_12635 [Sphingomonas sp. NSE70-1]|uniref:Uncharacterized protein n=1 Tax=Sphingomonas caseinilyticus TaxID=2908205 RepID=A0ABT0RX90_9SPHN|nr:hypothetical protein [Sphingomonas caseinilyticus]MCL6699625.1 hypothetical protein [Sphingomonas caseinilyticus]